MKRIIAFFLCIVSFISSYALASAESDYQLNLDLQVDNVDLLEGLYKNLRDYYDESLQVRGYLKWGMSVDEVVQAMENEMHNDENMCTEVTLYPSSNGLISYIGSIATVGDYKTVMYCYVTDLWGFYYAINYFIAPSTLGNEAYEEWLNSSDEVYLEKYETIEKTMNYVYGAGQRSIDKWDSREELANGYYIIKTYWKKGASYIFLNCLKQSDVFQIVIEYQSPKYPQYKAALEQDLTITGPDMFYGF